MQLVPFFSEWTGSETKLDIRAIYSRPSLHGGITLTSPLPLRRHVDWTAKGFTYISVATLEELGTVAPFLRSRGLDPLEMRGCFDAQGRFKIAEYLAEGEQAEDAVVAALDEKVAKFGAEAVTEMMRVKDPAFVLPKKRAARKVS